MIMLVSKLITKAQNLMLSRGFQLGTTGAVIADLLNIDVLRQWALELAPGSDADALEEAARTSARMLGLEGDEVLWPRQKNGTPITPKYLVIDLGRGRAWYSTRYNSFKSVRAANNRGFRRGTNFGKRELATTATAMGRS